MNTQTTESNWDTEETSRIIANDEAMYNRAVQLARNAYSIKRLAHLMKQVFEDAMSAYPHSNIDIDAIDWEFVASEYMED